MKRQWGVLLVFVLGSTLAVQLGRCAAPPSLAGLHPARNGDDRDSHHHDGDHRDHDRRFDDHDRRFAHDYYEHHRHERGFRDRDRLSREYESRLREGYVLDPYLRTRIYAAPRDMVRGFGPPPPGWRYVVIGGHVMLIDPGYRIHDMIHLEFNLHL